MDKVALIAFLSLVMWYIIDRFKPLWECFKNGKYITIAVSGLMAFGLTFGFGLDIVSALDFFPDTVITGNILTGLLLMSGSSAVSEIITRIKTGTPTVGFIEAPNLELEPLRDLPEAKVYQGPLYIEEDAEESCEL